MSALSRLTLSKNLTCGVLGVLFGKFSESQSKDFKEPVDEEEFADDYGYLSDSDLEDDEDENSSFKHINNLKINSFDPFPAPGEDKEICEKNEEHVGKGKVVKVPDVAFVTWVEVGGLFRFPLTVLQVPSFSDVSLHGNDWVRAVRVGRESQIAKCGDRRPF